ncbi:MAG: hypothetical protein E7480_02450 [Ruminococcaceae bacterium]|nr:hypothetical protein [Oscillospiraceae bacterium]
MVKATKGIYQINCSLDCISINHVGDDWIEEITYNEKSIEDGDIIIASLKDDITIIGKVIENDNIPDYGSSSVTISVSGGEKTTQFYVKENRGRYAGNSAVWELNCSVKLLERV